MKKIINKIRLQPPEFRGIIAIIAALVVTLIIGMFWITSLSSTRAQSKESETLDPLSLLIANIKGVFLTSQQKEQNFIPPQNTIQIINSGLENTSSDTQ